MNEYQLYGIINVDTNDTILDPSRMFMPLDDNGELNYDFELPDTFNWDKYMNVICDLVVSELQYLLKEFHTEMKCQYVPSSACIKYTADIESDYIQNQRCGMFRDINMLCFKVKTEHETTDEELQRAFNKFFVDEREFDEYCPVFEIYQGIVDKYALVDFL